MAIENLHNFLNDYFSANYCTVNANRYNLDVQLTDEIDEQLMNRPFYWQYVRKLGRIGEPQTLKLTTDLDQQSKDRELIHFGTPRLQQIITHLQKHAKFVRLYQRLEVNQQTPVIPWFIINLKISYTGKQKKEDLQSIGINLINGVMITDIFPSLTTVQWESSICDYCYPITPLIKIPSSYQRIINYLTEQIKRKEHDWAATSWAKMEEEKELLAYFYQETDASEQELFQLETAAIEALYQPKIEFEVINGGLFHLSQTTTNQFSQH